MTKIYYLLTKNLYSDLLFRALSFIVRKIYKFRPDSSSRRVLVFPAITKEDELGEVVNKIAWWLPFREGVEIYVPTSDILYDKYKDKPALLKVPEEQTAFLSGRLSHINLCRTIPKIKFDTILVNRYTYIYHPFILRNLHKEISIIDKFFLRNTDTDAYERLYNSTLSSMEYDSIKENSYRNYLNLIDANRKKTRSLCVMTGPSLDSIKDLKVGDKTFVIACNTAINNDSVLEKIGRIDALAVIDRNAFFSSARHAAEYRENLKEFVLKSRAYVLTKESRVPLLLNSFPELRPYVIGIPIIQSMVKGPEFPDKEKFQIFIDVYSNVFTTIVMPVASAINNEIYIIGADGTENPRKRWGYGKIIKENSAIAGTVDKTHPAKQSARNQYLYYKIHCKAIEEIIKYGEGQGKKYIAITESFIDILKEKYLKVNEI